MTASSLFRDRRGVSEIIASLILVLIVTAAGTVAYSMSLNSFSQSSSLFQLQTGQREEQARERFAVIAVSWDATEPNRLNLTVLNYGKTDVTVDAVYVNGTAVATYLGGKGVKTGASNLVFVGFNSSAPILTGQTYDILVVSERGGRNEIFWEA
jgi:flagellin-like protein